MTYRSCWIEEATELQDGVSGIVLRLDRSGSTPPSPTDLEAWAAATGLPLSYVDNCWVRLSAQGRALRELLEGQTTTEQRRGVDLASLDPERVYVLSAEEF